MFSRNPLALRRGASGRAVSGGHCLCHAPQRVANRIEGGRRLYREHPFDPLLAQLYFFYFGLPSLGIRIPEEATGVLALTLNSGAYMAEIIRAGIKSISHGQIEAALSSGLNYFQRMRYIVLPQALGVSIPPILGQSIVLVKDSALLSLISIVELTRAGQILTSERFMPAEGFLTTAAFYLIIYYILKTLSHWSQKRLIFREA